jgi:hypothetical protein
MRTTFPLAVMLALALTFAMFSGSGFNDIVRGDNSGVGEASEELDSQANDSAVSEDEDVEGSRAASDEGSLVGVIIGAGQSVMQLFTMVALMPLTLRNLGFPAWFATPVGSLVYVVSGVGILQFITGRVLE